MTDNATKVEIADVVVQTYDGEEVFLVVTRITESDGLCGIEFRTREEAEQMSQDINNWKKTSGEFFSPAEVVSK